MKLLSITSVGSHKHLLGLKSLDLTCQTGSVVLVWYYAWKLELIGVIVKNLMSCRNWIVCFRRVSLWPVLCQAGVLSSKPPSKHICASAPVLNVFFFKKKSSIFFLFSTTLWDLFLEYCTAGSLPYFHLHNYDTLTLFSLLSSYSFLDNVTLGFREFFSWILFFFCLESRSREEEATYKKYLFIHPAPVKAHQCMTIIHMLCIKLHHFHLL
jgi:hypothetical protein